jgi:hypothetical protein
LAFLFWKYTIWHSYTVIWIFFFCRKNVGLHYLLSAKLWKLAESSFSSLGKSICYWEKNGRYSSLSSCTVVTSRTKGELGETFTPRDTQFERKLKTNVGTSYCSMFEVVGTTVGRPSYHTSPLPRTISLSSDHHLDQSPEGHS